MFGGLGQCFPALILLKHGGGACSAGFAWRHGMKALLCWQLPVLWEPQQLDTAIVRPWGQRRYIPSGRIDLWFKLV